jgi:MinD superfamily P-loop ATPase
MYAIDQEKCLQASDCVTACPIDVIVTMSDGKFAVGEDCTDCGACEPACDARAIHMVQ